MRRYLHYSCRNISPVQLPVSNHYCRFHLSFHFAEYFPLQFELFLNSDREWTRLCLFTSSREVPFFFEYAFPPHNSASSNYGLNASFLLQPDHKVTIFKQKLKSQRVLSFASHSISFAFLKASKFLKYGSKQEGKLG